MNKKKQYKFFIISLDILDNYNYSKKIIQLLCDLNVKFNNIKILIFFYSGNKSRINNAKNKYTDKLNKFKLKISFVPRSFVKEKLFPVINNNSNATCFILGVKNIDFYTATNNKLPLIYPKWLNLETEEKVERYALTFESLIQLHKFLITNFNQNNWFLKYNINENTKLLSLSDARTLDAFIKSDKEKQVNDAFKNVLKKGRKTYYQMFLYYFMSSVINNREIFKDIDYWCYFPSSKSNTYNKSNPMHNFKEAVREMMGGQPLISCKEYNDHKNLFFRYKDTMKSHLESKSKRIDIGAKKHLDSIKLVSGYKNYLKGKNICIFDDYITHGNSLESARNLLVHCKVNKIVMVTLGAYLSDYQYQEFKILSSPFEKNLKYKEVTRKIISKEKFSINSDAKCEVENLHSIFNLKTWYNYIESGDFIDKYIIALKYLKIENNFIINLLNNFSKLDFINLFKGYYIELEFMYNVGLNKYANILSDKYLLTKSINYAIKIINLNKKLSVKTLLYTDPKYPINLKSIDNPPAILYYKGNEFRKKHEKSIACVGSRNITNFGKSFVDEMIPNLVNEQFTIVSGLAIGVDSYCHKVCLDSDGITIAVLPSGLDNIYPKTNKFLANKILSKNGILVSEYPPGTIPKKSHFIERNRIISGLCKGTIAFEGSINSGTSHTVNFSIDQNRKVFVPFTKFNDSNLSLAYYLLSENLAIPIYFKNAFDTIVLNLGYKINNKVKSNKIKLKKSASIINNIYIDSINDIEDFNLKYDKTCSFNVNNEYYSTFKSILYSNDLTIKDFMNTLIKAIVDQHK